MKRAFTLTELIFTIILVSILAVTATTAFQKETLTPATNQVLDHIRYTQQLAMNQDMYTPSPDFAPYGDATRAQKASRQWFKQWWQIQFHQDSSYSVYSDYPSGTNNHNFDNVPVYSSSGPGDTIAKDPNSGYFIARPSSNVPADQILERVKLQEEYGVTVSMRGCGSDHLLFDALGRPHCSMPQGSTGLNPYANMVQSDLCVELSDGSESNAITVAAITGYASVDFGGSCP